MVRCPSVRPSSIVRPFTFSKIFFSKAAWSIKAKFYVEPPWVGETKVNLGHVTSIISSDFHFLVPESFHLVQVGTVASEKILFECF